MANGPVTRTLSVMAADPRRDYTSLLPELTPREHATLELVANGLSNAEIARRHRVSVHAVKFHLASIYRKLGVTNRTEASVAYLRAELGRSR